MPWQGPGFGECIRVWKWLIAVFLIIVAGCAGGGWWFKSSGNLDKVMEQFRPDLKATPVRLEKSALGNLVRTVSAPGLTEPKTKVSISAQVSARIIALPFREGQDVKAGDVIVRLDARDLAAALDSAKAQLKSEEARVEGAKAQLANSTSELGRRKELYSSKDISKADLDLAEVEYSRAVTSLRQAEFSVDIARANISRAEKDLENAIIKSPIDGTVIIRNAEVGELVVVGTFNNAGTVIMQIADLSEMLVKAKVDEANVSPVRVGQKAKVTFNAFPDQTFSAAVQAIRLQRQLDKDGTTYFETELLLEIPKGVRVLWGLQSNADIEVETIRDVVRVPSQAVLDRPVDELPSELREGAQYVDKNKKFARVLYTMTDGKAKTVPVSVGPSDVTHTVVLGGLKDGETIITGPFKALLSIKEGQRVVDESTLPKKDEPKRAEAAADGPGRS